MRRAGVNVEFVAIDPQAPTGTVRVAFEDGQPRYTIGDGVAWDRIRASGALVDLVAEADAFCFGTLAQRTPLAFDELARALGPRPRALRVLDLNLRAPHDGADLAARSIALCDVLKLNDHELDAARALLDAPDLVSWVFESSPVRVVAVTHGAGGSTLFTRHTRAFAPGFPSSGRDPVGAGDAFTAVLASELARGRPLPEVAEKANRYAAWVAGQVGGMPQGGPEL